MELYKKMDALLITNNEFNEVDYFCWAALCIYTEGHLISPGKGVNGSYASILSQMIPPILTSFTY